MDAVKVEEFWYVSFWCASVLVEVRLALLLVKVANQKAECKVPSLGEHGFLLMEEVAHKEISACF